MYDLFIKQLLCPGQMPWMQRILGTGQESTQDWTCPSQVTMHTHSHTHFPPRGNFESLIYLQANAT